MDIQRIVINKNRGWRGLAEVRCLNKENKSEMDMIFSFSQPVWDDMQSGRIVLQDEEDYIIVHFDNTEALPKGQRSVLLKNFVANIIDVIRFHIIFNNMYTISSKLFCIIPIHNCMI